MLFSALAVLAVAGSARADSPPDGVYGRLDGDFVLSAGAGGGAHLDDLATSATWTGELRFRYLDTAGLVVAVQEEDLRAIVAGDFRPLFLIRFLLNEWSGRAFLDLLLDSVGFELGAALLRPFDDGTGVALALGCGFDVPIATPVFLRLAARHVRAGAQDRAAPAQMADWSFLAVLTVRGTVDLGVASREPPRFQPDR
jgi:hypothetical protein